MEHSSFHIESGTCYAIFGFDVGLAIDLDRCADFTSRGG